MQWEYRVQEPSGVLTFLPLRSVFHVTQVGFQYLQWCGFSDKTEISATVAHMSSGV